MGIGLTYEDAKKIAEMMDIDIDGVPEEIAIRMMEQFAENVVKKMTSSKKGVEEEVDENLGPVLNIRVYQDRKGNKVLGIRLPGKIAPMISDLLVAIISDVIEKYEDKELDDHEFKSVEEAVGQYFIDMGAGLGLYFKNNPGRHDELGEDVFRIVTGIPVGKSPKENPMFG